MKEKEPRESGGQRPNRCPSGAERSAVTKVAAVRCMQCCSMHVGRGGLRGLRERVRGVGEPTKEESSDCCV
jgi:hypothetical protein